MYSLAAVLDSAAAHKDCKSTEMINFGIESDSLQCAQMDEMLFRYI